MKKSLLLLVAILFAFNSCTVQKRIHQPGYYFSLKSHKKPAQTIAQNGADKHAGKTNTAAPLIESPQAPPPETAIFASADNRNDPGLSSVITSYTSTECDQIVMRNGEEISAKVTEVSFDLIRFKRCDNPDGPMYSVNKGDVFMIRYANGTKEVIKESDTQTQTKQAATVNSQPPLKKKREPLAVISFLVSLVALIMPVEFLLVSLLFLVAALIMGIIAVNKINAHPDTLRGKGFAIAGIVISLVFGSLLVLALSMI